MNKIMIGAVVLMAAGLAFAQSFTDVDTTKHQGKTGLKDLITVLDANFALIEAGGTKQGTANVSNGATVTVSTASIVLTGTGGAAGATNTMVFATPYTAGSLYVLTVDSASTNDIKIADNGTTMALGSDLVLEPTDAAILYAVSTTKMVKVAASGSN
jgi:hypothetical protein